MNKYPCKVLVFALALGGAATTALAAASAHPGTGMAAQVTQPTHTLPAALQPVFYRALARDAGPAYAINKDGCAKPSEPKLTACFDDGGVRFTGSGSPLALHLVAWGREPIGEAGSGRLTAVESVKPAIRGNEAQYRHGDLTEWWRVLPVGFEQGFTIAERPAGNGELTLALATSRQGAGAPTTRRHGESRDPVKNDILTSGRDTTSHRIPAFAGMTNNPASAMTEEGNGNAVAWGKLRYGKLVVTDANGTVVPATLTSNGDRVLIAVNDAHAAYPLTVDPLLWIEQKVTSPNGTFDDFGASVVVSGDTAMIGSPWADHGAVYVYEKSNGSWHLTQTLLPSDVSEDDLGFGCSIVIDGDTALIGDNASVVGYAYVGSAYVYTESGGTWTETQRLIGTSDKPVLSFGSSVALAGSTALIGAPGSTGGQAFVFTKVGGSWVQQQELIPTDIDIIGAGKSVALHGPFAFVGSPCRGCTPQHPATGKIFVFINANGTWEHSGNLTAENQPENNYFGEAISALGNKLLIGAPRDDGGIGAVYEFTWSGSAWTQTQKIVLANGEASGFGYSIARSGDTALISAGGGTESAAYLFSDSGGLWSQGQKFVPANGADEYGMSVALEGAQALVGAPMVSLPGNAYFYTEGDLGLAVSAPTNVGQGEQYVAQTIATNNANSASPAMSATMAVPAGASFVSADATQGSCSEAGNLVTCDFGQIGGNAGTVAANVTLEATGNAGDLIDNTASIALATPPLTASAATTIGEGGTCPDGYSEYDGNADGHQVVQIVSYEAAAGEENAILSGPAGIQLYVRTVIGGVQKLYRIPGNEIHREAPAGTYTWGAKAGGTGGGYTLCIEHP